MFQGCIQLLTPRFGLGSIKVYWAIFELLTPTDFNESSASMLYSTLVHRAPTNAFHLVLCITKDWISLHSFNCFSLALTSSTLWPPSPSLRCWSRETFVTPSAGLLSYKISFFFRLITSFILPKPPQLFISDGTLRMYFTLCCFNHKILFLVQLDLSCIQDTSRRSFSWYISVP